MLIDIRRINGLAVKAANTGMIILGGGMVKHHICNANLMVGFPAFRKINGNCILMIFS